MNDPKLLKQIVPELVDRATYDAAQSALNSKSTAGRPPVDREASWLRGHVYCGVCGGRMQIKRHLDTYAYKCPRSRSKVTTPDVCPSGEMTIIANRIDKPVYEALTYLLMRREWATQLMAQRLGSGKIEALASMAESYQAQIAENRQLLETARRRALQTTDDEIAGQILHDAEELNAIIHGLEQEYAEARDQLDTFNAGNAWIQSVMERIAHHNPIRETPAPDDVKAFPLEERRLLLAASGLHAEVYPKNWTGERVQGGAGSGKRVEVFFDWVADQLLRTKDRLRTSYT
jgi:hypothetical protein